MLDYLIFATTFVIFLILAVIYLYPGSKKSTTIPGPEPVDPLEGNFPDIKSSGSLHEFLENIHDTYGTIASFWAGTQLCVSVASPKLFEEHSHIFDRPGEFFRAAALLWGENSLFTLNGSEGRRKHSFIKGLFNETFIDSFLRNNNKLLEQQMKDWSSLPHDQYFPLYEKVSSFMIKSVVSSILGMSTENQQEMNSFKGNLENVLLEVEHYVLDMQDVDGKREKRMDQCKNNISTFLTSALKSRKSDPSFAEKILPIDKILDLPEEEAVMDLLVIVFDAYLKCSSFLTWFGYFLALETDVQRNLKNEIMSLNITKLTLHDVSNLSNFQAVTKEVLRCANIVPYSARYQNIDSQIESHKIPAGTPVIHALGVVSNDSTVFENPEEFNPGRFKEGGSSCHPFGFAGKRTCPGEQFAVTQAAIFFAYMLDSFELELAPDQIASPHYGFYVKPKEEIWLSLKPCISSLSR